MELKKLFNPSSIAIVGVSHETNKVGYLTAKNIIDQGYKGELYFVNNKYKGKILGKTVYPSLTSIKRAVDAVVLAVPGNIALLILDEMIKLRIVNAVIYAAGFKETGKEGEKLENELFNKAKKHNINILGPNCLGYVNTKAGINATFLKNIAPAGNIGFVSQSGALGSYLCDYFSGHINLGFSYFISLGNKTVIDESDVLEFLANDKDTDVIGMYLEDIKNGSKFRSIAEIVTKRKPVVVIKSGTTSQGSKAALSHTGGMIGDDQVYESVFNQSGIIRAKSLGGFLTLLKLFSYKKLPTGKSVLILSNAGGAGVLLTDELVKNKLELATISEKTKNNVLKYFNESKKVTVNNPIDLLGDASAFDYKTVIETTIKEKNIGSVIVLLTPQANTEISKTAQIIVDIQRHFTHPIYPIFMGKKSMTGVGRLFEENKIAGFANFDFLPKAISDIIWWRSNRGDELKSVLTKLNTKCQILNVKSTVVASVIKQSQPLNIIDSLKILQLVDIPIEPIHLATSVNDLKKITDKTGFPVVVKIISDKISHKTETGGVITNIKTIKELQEVYKKLSLQYNIIIEQSGGKIGIQKMIKGSEILIGAKRDETFGPVVVFGLGGTYTELLKEISYLVYPFTYEQFSQKINESRLGKLMAGFRKNPPVDLKKLYEIANNIGRLMTDFIEIKEIDINPLIALGNKIIAVDSRIIL